MPESSVKGEATMKAAVPSTVPARPIGLATNKSMSISPPEGTSLADKLVWVQNIQTNKRIDKVRNGFINYSSLTGSLLKKTK